MKFGMKLLATVEVWEWISDFFSHFITDAITLSVRVLMFINANKHTNISVIFKLVYRSERNNRTWCTVCNTSIRFGLHYGMYKSKDQKGPYTQHIYKTYKYMYMISKFT